MESEVDDSTSMESVCIDTDGIIEELTNTIGAKLLNHSPLPASCCIFRVPHQIRRQKIQAYEPDIVSIGPFHRGRGGDQFQLMEKVKRWYLQCLLADANITLATLITGVVDFNKRARDCYAEPLDHFNKKDFVEMMVIDGCFLIELFRKGLSVDQQDENDPVFNVSCMLQYLYHDLLLLENQLPWFVLERLYNSTAMKNTTSEGNASSLTDLVLNFFRQSVADDGIFIFKPSPNLPPEPLHILDLIRTVIVVPFEDLGSKRKEEGEDQQQSKERELPQRVPNVTTLSEAGIKFQKSFKTPDCIMNIKFGNGAFTIPPLAIDERTGPLFRNLIAFEQCCHSRLHKITSYAVLMDNLIDSSKDIDLLCEVGILVNWLSSEDAAQFFNELYKDTTVIGFYYEGLCNDVNKYYKTDWNKWMEKLRREHFGTPWAIISLVAAFILLVLTMLQTVYAIHQYYHPPK
ncbi:UPF0481 protein At3g47200-like isoform X1 [Pyrus x bretschneideri]|uniref:UPF0481 protein At3g47200-like isoform X1 n=1 Tax=Pyrus x bretschneideri TaxID=225117 RepID=UPI00202F95C1|nr:UPF0481 protein At3g47200-like isoform X1 [Pyrus x bretschneideri]